MNEPWKTIVIWCAVVGGSVAGVVIAGPWGLAAGFALGVALAFWWR